MIQEFVPPGHFYSVIPNITNEYNNIEEKFLQIDFNLESHQLILNELNDYLKYFEENFCIKNNEQLKTNIIKRQSQLKYTLMNDTFEWMDGRLLHYFLQKKKPRKMIEIGSGNSTLLTSNTNDLFKLGIEIICIEPYPSDYLKLLHSNHKITLIEKIF